MAKNVFISHASKDKSFVRSLAGDLKEIGHRVWLDEWEIKVGDCIISKIEDGVKNADYVIIVLSVNSVVSGWVEKEWKSKYWDEISAKKIYVLPVLIDDCEIPELLKTKKYADFSKSYSKPFFELNKAIEPLVKSEPQNNEVFLSNSFEEKILERDLLYLDLIESYENIPTVLNLYDNKRRVVCVESAKSVDGLGFDLYKTTDLIADNNEIYFLYLHKGAGNYRTYDYIFEKYSHMIPIKQMIILLQPDKKIVDFEKRRKNISELYGSNNIYFLNEFVWKYCNTDDFREKDNFQISNFVEPYLRGEDKMALSYMKEWLEGDEEFLVVKGGGGIGKTTLVKKINQLISDKYVFVKVIYIDVAAIKNNLMRYSDMLDHELDLYDLYVVNNGGSIILSGVELISKELFKINFEFGNIVFIVDGLDEVISKYADKFDFYSFLGSIKEYNSASVLSGRKSKVLFTCRSYFLNKRKYAHIAESVIEVIPFNKVLAELYFQSCFEGNKRYVEKGMKIASILMGGGKDIEYIPFVLDIIKRILLETKGGFELSDVSFVSLLLDVKNKYDYIVYRVCYREIEKHDLGLDVDMQVRLFMEMACVYESPINKDTFSGILKSLIGRRVSDQTLDALFSHPFLDVVDNFVRFRYDFFAIYFKNIFLYDYFLGNYQLDEKLKMILLKKMNVSMINDVSIRLGSVNDELLLKFIDTIAWIRKDPDLPEEDKDRILSDLLLIALKSQQNTRANTKNENTALLKNMFTEQGEVLEGFVIKGLTEMDYEKMIFDFKGMFIKNSKFVDYDYFWECDFDEYTVFENCVFEGVRLKKDIKTKAVQKNFVQCTGDETFRNALHKRKQESSDNMQKILFDIKGFLKTFYVRGNMLPRREDVIKTMFKGDGVYYIKLLNEGGLIERYDSEKKTLGVQWKIKSEYIEGCTDFCFQGVMIKIINDIVASTIKKDS
ncbi:MAG: toll/interleukin-1 receptor domain-containing protein [Chlorobiaceae bacterium]|nr:toll/interleukin-1 receptor domain-containing protein [Chlorobiaceae bacterium]NTW09739.1 toll/interleukin-1 receptor domain-containing protein [Chlorobiaceae bacterium]